jgi:hypothetical protein
MKAADVYDWPEFQDWLEAAARTARIRIDLEANKLRLAKLQKELEESE